MLTILTRILHAGPVQFIENCSLPDPLPTKPALTDVNLARQRGICYAACANEVIIQYNAPQAPPTLQLPELKVALFNPEGGAWGRG